VEHGPSAHHDDDEHPARAARAKRPHAPPVIDWTAGVICETSDAGSGAEPAALAAAACPSALTT
jgi:hypothetical protein